MLNGQDLIYWFGVVEDNGDPLGHGRVRVRIHGHHNFDQEELPTLALPWAVVLMPVTSASVAGMGQSPTGLQPGSRVYGFFLDGETRQQPMVLGSLVGDAINSFTGDHNPEGSPSQPNVFEDLTCDVMDRENDCQDAFDNQNLNEVIDERNKRGFTVNPSEWYAPCTGFVSSAYGRRGVGRHNGVDICQAGIYEQTDPGASHLNGLLRGPVGKTVSSAADGEVIYIWTSDEGQGGAHTTYDVNKSGTRSFGNAVAIKHNTESLGDCITIYAHLGTSQDAAEDFNNPGQGIDVSVGQRVSKGQKIGTIGRTHVWDSPTHLHFEIRLGTALPKSSNHINPGLVFPQMMNKHTTFLSWMQNKKYDADPIFSEDDAPIVRGNIPRET